MDSLGKSAALSMALQGKAASDAQKTTEALSSLGPTADKPDELRQVAEQFESLFIEQMMAAGRKSELAEGLLKNKGSETFYSLLDREYAGMASKKNSLGIADALVAQFRPNVKDGDHN